MTFTKNSSGKKQASMPSPNSPAYKKLLAAQRPAPAKDSDKPASKSGGKPPRPSPPCVRASASSTWSSAPSGPRFARSTTPSSTSRSPETTSPPRPCSTSPASTRCPLPNRSRQLRRSRPPIPRSLRLPSKIPISAIRSTPSSAASASSRPAPHRHSPPRQRKIARETLIKFRV